MTPSRWLRLAATGSLLAGGLALTTSLPAAAATCTSGVEGDVNGDGYAEVAVSEAGRAFGKGAVHVFYGRAKGITASASGSALDDGYLDQDEPGVAGVAKDYDDFGVDLAFGDYNDDGCADLAVGAGSSGRVTTADTVWIFYGSKTGLKSVGSKQLSYKEIVGNPAASFGSFGRSLTAGDLDDDGITDLTVSVPTSDGRDTLAVLAGGSGGLDEARSQVLDRDAAGVDEDAEFGTRTIGDFDGDGLPEIAVNIQDGAVQMFEGDADGLTPTTAEPITGVSLGIDDFIPGEDGEPGNRVFGEIMEAGDVDADGHDDLAVGLPALGNQGGEVALVRGSETGLTSTGLQRWNQATPGVAGTPGEDDAFGAALAMGRLDTGPTDDLAIGVPSAVIDGQRGAGSAVILLGSGSGLTTAGDGGARYHQKTTGVAGTAENDERFGRALTIANVQSKTQGSLVIGAPRETIRSVGATGQFLQLSIAAAGPKASGSVTFNLDSTGVRGASRKEAELGRDFG